MMQGSNFIWLDNKLVDWEKAKVHSMTHSLHYGDAVFEGVRFYKTEKGTAIFRLKEHVDRLFHSASVFDMKVPLSNAEVFNAVKETVKSNGVEEGYIRPFLFFGEKMGLNNIDLEAHFSVIVIPWGSYLGENAVKVKTSKFIRIHPSSSFMTAKISGHYANSILASADAKKAGFDEALLLDYKGNIAEGPGENFFIIKDGKLLTPKPGTILPGITRDSIFKIAKDEGIEALETDLTLEDAYYADEAFFTGTAAEVTLIESLDNKKIGDGKGKIGEKLKQIYKSAVRGKDKRYLSWLELVK